MARESIYGGEVDEAQMEAHHEFATYRQDCINLAKEVRDNAIESANRRYAEAEERANAFEMQQRAGYDKKATN